MAQERFELPSPGTSHPRSTIGTIEPNVGLQTMTHPIVDSRPAKGVYAEFRYHILIGVNILICWSSDSGEPGNRTPNSALQGQRVSVSTSPPGLFFKAEEIGLEPTKPVKVLVAFQATRFPFASLPGGSSPIHSFATGTTTFIASHEPRSE